MRSFNNCGVQRAKPSFLRRTGGLGVSLNLKFPQEWGKQGVEKSC